MPRLISLGCALIVIAGCGPQKPPPIPGMTITVKPNTLADDGTKAVVSVDVTDDQGTALTGTVSLTVEAGLLNATDVVAAVDLDENGHAKADYTCAKAADAKCTGPVKLEGRWERDGAFLVQVTRINVVPPKLDGGP